MVFISYSSVNREICVRVVEYLETNDINCWVAPRDILPGSHWMDSITDAIDECAVVLLLLTSSSNSSQQVKRELERAVSKGKTIIPYVLEEVQFSNWMQYCICIHHWQSTDVADFSRTLDSVVESLREFQQNADEGGISRLKDDLDRQAHSQSIIGEGLLAKIASMITRESEKECVWVDVGYSAGDSIINMNNTLLSLDVAIEKVVDDIISEVGLTRNRVVDRTRFRLLSTGTDFHHRCSAALKGAIELCRELKKISKVLEDKDIKDFRYGLNVQHGMLLTSPYQKEDDLTGTISIDGNIRRWLNLNSIPDPVTSTDDCIDALKNSVYLKKSNVYSCDFVGREKELTRLDKMVDKQDFWFIENPRGDARHLVAGISGQAGIGKSALVNRVIKEMDDRLFLMIGRASARPDSAGGIWLDLLSSLLGVPDGGIIPPEILVSQLSEMMNISYSKEQSRLLSDFIAPQSIINGSGSEDTMLSIQVAIRDLIQACMEEKDILIVLEDVHASDEFSLGILRFVLANTKLKRPILLILTFRPESGIGESIFLNLPSGYFESLLIELGGLESDAERDLIKSLLGVVAPDSEPSEDLLSFLTHRSQGNPLFVKELTVSMIHEGVIQLKDGIWLLEASESLGAVPSEVKEVLARRIESLPQRLRLMLQCLSVLGEEFPLDVYNRYLSTLVPDVRMDSSEFLGEMSSLLVMESSAFRRTIRFGHVLVRDYLYESLPRDASMELHGLAASILAESLSTDPGSVAMHFHSAGELASALDWGFRNLDRLNGIHSNGLVVEWCDKLLSWLTEDDGLPGNSDMELDILMQQLNAYDALGMNDEQENLLIKVQNLSEACGKDDRLFAVALQRGMYLTAKGEMKSANVFLNRARVLAYKSGDRNELRKYHQAYARYLRLKGDTTGAGKHIEDALKLTEENGDARAVCMLKLRLGRLKEGWGDHTSARTLFSEAIKIARQNHMPVSELSVLHSLGKSYFNTGTWSKARETWDRAIKLSRSLGRRKTEASILNELGILLSSTNSIQEALDIQNAALKTMTEVGNKHGICKILLDIGALHTRMGDSMKALDCLKESLQIAEETGNRGAEGAALNNLSSLYKNLCRFTEAEETLNRSATIWREMGNIRLTGAALANLGSIYEKTGKLEKAEECFRNAIDLARSCCDLAGEGVRQGNLGVMMQLQHRWEEAEYLYCQALEIARKLNSPRHEAVWLGFLAALNDTLDRQETAYEQYMQSLELHRKTADRQHQQITLGNLGGLLFEMNRMEEALELQSERLSMCRDMKLPDGEAGSLCSIGMIMYKIGRIEESIDYYIDACRIASEIKLGVHMFRGIVPFYRTLKKDGYPEADSSWPSHWGDPDLLIRDEHMDGI